MNWIIIFIILCGAILLLVLRGMKGPAHTFETIRRPINDLLTRGYDGGFLIIDVSGKQCFLQLRKYVKTSRDYGIELAFPKAKWSDELFDSVIHFCDINNFHYSLSKKESKEDELDFLYIDFGQDISKAHNCVKRIFSEILGVSEKTKLFVRLENARIK